MTTATVGVVGSKEIVLIVVSSLFMLVTVTAVAVVLWKLMKREQGRPREPN